MKSASFYSKSKNSELKLYDLLRMYRERATKHLTQKELARLVGVSDKSIRDWEYGVSLPGTANLKKLIEVFLSEKLLTPGQEQNEAEELWVKRREEDNFNTFAPFDFNWFNTIIKTGQLETEQELNRAYPSDGSSMPPSAIFAKESGLLTFLFTDIESSTRLWESHPEAMRTALAQHDGILRRSIETNKGKVFKTVGDAFYATFSKVSDALQSVLETQRQLNKVEWGETGALKVRMALHTGTAEERDGDYFGPALNRVARILSSGHGGQMLLSLATAELVRDLLPAGHNLRDLGEHRLKNLSRSEHIFQLVAPDLPSEFPPLATLEVVAHNLPVQLTSFVGREDELAELKQLLTETRLLTLVGSGGAGKTRLAIELTSEVLENYHDGVWLAELASTADPNLVAQTVATALDIREVPGQPILKTIQEYLRSKQLLLVLDNCEHLVEAVARFADAVLKAGSNVQILATSREALGIVGETSWRIPSLSLPSTETLPPLDKLSQYGAIRLFMERAEVVQRGFTLTTANAPAVVKVCIRLDGIPLAIELAAARIKSLSAEQIATRLDDAFRLLTQGGRTTLPRHQTLRAAIDWSYALLPEQEQILMRRLAIFNGGWTVEAAEAVCSGGEIEDFEVLDYLSRLVDKSLVVTDESVPGYPDQVRYRHLETIRQYALEKMRISEEIEEIAKKHQKWFLAMAKQAEPELRGSKQILWFHRIETEHDNLRMVLERARVGVNPQASEEGLQLAAVIWWFWYVRGHFSEGQGWLKDLLEKYQANSLYRAKALHGAGFIAAFLGDNTQATLLYEEALDLFRQVGSKSGEAFVLASIARQKAARGDLAAAQIQLEESLEVSRKSNDLLNIGFALDMLGTIAAQQNDYETAKDALSESLTIRRQLGDKLGLAASLMNLSGVAWLKQDFGQALALQKESLAIWEELGDRRGIARTLNSMGQTASAQNDFTKAETFYSKSLSMSRELGERRSIMSGLCRLGEVATQLQNHNQAENYFKESLTICRELGNKIIASECLEGLGWIAATLHKAQIAARLMGAAEGLRSAISIKLSPNDQKGHKEALEQIHSQLDSTNFEEQWELGRVMPLEGVVAYVLAQEICNEA